MSTFKRSAKATPRGQPRMSEDVRLHARTAMTSRPSGPLSGPAEAVQDDDHDRHTRFEPVQRPRNIR
jgi:hypothetical protein